MVLGVWEWGKDVCGTAFRCAGYVHLFFSLIWSGVNGAGRKACGSYDGYANMRGGGLEIKLVIAAIYTNYTTKVIDDEGIEQDDGYTVGPVGNKLILRFEKLDIERSDSEKVDCAQKELGAT